MNIKKGQIWEVTDENFYGTGNQMEGKREVRFHIKKGEKIEIRYPFAWNYRTEDNIYMSSKEEYILNKCKYWGDVKPHVKDRNKATLEEILRLELFDKAIEL